MNFEPAKEFFRLCLGEDWQTAALPVEVSGDRIAELLWPFNDLFRRRLPELAGLVYDPTFDNEADSLIDDIAVTLDISMLGKAPAGMVQILTSMLQKIQAASALSMVLKRSRTIGLLPTSIMWWPPGCTSKPARLMNP